jgi:hypothetical protein
MRSSANYQSVIFDIVVLFAEVFLLIVLTKQKLRLRYPIFFSFFVLNVLATLSEIFSFYFFSPLQYFYIYRFFAAVNSLVGLAVLYEAFINGIKPFDALADLGRMLFGWAVLFVGIAGFLTAVATSGPLAHKTATAILMVGRTVALMQCVPLLFLLLFNMRQGLHWRTPEVVIVTGLGAYASIQLIASYVQNAFPRFDRQVNSFETICFLALLLFWALMLKFPEPEKNKSVIDHPSKLIFQRWNDVLTNYSWAPRQDSVASELQKFFIKDGNPRRSFLIMIVGGVFLYGVVNDIAFHRPLNRVCIEATILASVSAVVIFYLLASFPKMNFSVRSFLAAERSVRSSPFKRA